jgi:hypothetical protein
VYNRKLKKHLKPFDNTCVVDVATDWDLFTRHGLHLKLKGKEKIASTIAKTIKAMLNKGKSMESMKKIKDQKRKRQEPRERSSLLETRTIQ